MKISLSVKALEHLLGGNSEVEIELRHQVVNEFTKRHLRDVVTTQTYKDIVREYTKSLENAIRQQMGEESWQLPSVSSVVKARIDAAVKKSIEDAVAPAIANKVREYANEWAAHIDSSVKRIFESNIRDLVREELTKRMKLAAKAAFNDATSEVF